MEQLVGCNMTQYDLDDFDCLQSVPKKQVDGVADIQEPKSVRCMRWPGSHGGAWGNPWVKNSVVPWVS